MYVWLLGNNVIPIILSVSMMMSGSWGYRRGCGRRKMIEKNKPIVIERVENGYVVREALNNGALYVFNDMGYPSASKDNQDVDDTLLGFVAGHFYETP